MKTAVVYARYSSTNQTEQSIEGQVHVCEDLKKLPKQVHFFVFYVNISK